MALSKYCCVFLIAMPVFNDLAIELQEAIWKLVLPTSSSRGVHWVEVEGVPHEPDLSATVSV
jgi:hypothetical protein